GGDDHGLVVPAAGQTVPGRVSRRVGRLVTKRAWGRGPVEHPAAERRGPLPQVCYAFGADATADQRSW
ncbi:MAG: hypothetical protein ACRDQH_11745, partial [Pseudonocardiaceae bacterium]